MATKPHHGGLVGVGTITSKFAPMNHSTILDNIYYNSTREIIAKAKELRNNQTPAEKKLWQHINKGQIQGYKFRRQHPINFFIADFYCHELKLVIEVDGEYHEDKKQSEHDSNRTAEIERLGIKVLRFYNHQVLTDIEKVINTIKQSITDNKTKNKDSQPSHPL